MRIVFDTASVPPDSRPAFWADVLCSLYAQCRVSPEDPETYRGTVRHCVVPGMEASVIRSAPMQASSVEGHTAHDEQVAQRARQTAGNLAHAIKTPLAVLSQLADQPRGMPGCA